MKNKDETYYLKQIASAATTLSTMAWLYILWHAWPYLFGAAVIPWLAMQ